MIRAYRKVYDGLKMDPDGAMRLLFEMGAKAGLGTGAIERIRQDLIGKKARDLGLIERRQYGSKILEYSAFLSETAAGRQFVLRIVDRIDDRRLFNIFMAPEAGAIYCPLGAEGCRKMANIISSGGIKPLKKAETASVNFLQRQFGFRDTHSYGTIEKAERDIKIRPSKIFCWYQKISAYAAREKEGEIFVLKIRSRLKQKYGAYVFNYLLYYPFGSSGLRLLRKALGEYLDWIG